MADFPTEIHRFASFDGVELAFTELGPKDGRSAVLIHGFFSNAQVNWIRYGHAARLAERGFRVIMPDLRGHGLSAKPHEASAYPPDVLMRDGLALIGHLELTDYDLGGYSLGARTTLRMLVNGAAPRRAVIAGCGLSGMTHTKGRGNHFRNILTHLGSFPQGSNEWMAEAFLKTTKGDPEALIHVLDTFVDTSEAQIRQVLQPVLVVTGVDDDDNGSPSDLAALLPHGSYAEVPGNHMSAVTKPELGQAIADFLAG